MAEDAADVLREHGVEQAHVMGFSMGGAIAQELALAHPELVRSLVLNGSYSHPDAYFRQMVLSWMTAARHASSERELLETLLPLDLYAPGPRRRHGPALIAEALESPLAQTPEGFFAQAQACIDWPGSLQRLGAITAPVLVTVGGADIACPPRLSRALVAGLPNAELVVLPGEAHQRFQEVPEQFNRIVAGFWATRRASRERARGRVASPFAPSPLPCWPPPEPVSLTPQYALPERQGGRSAPVAGGDAEAEEQYSAATRPRLAP